MASDPQFHPFPRLPPEIQLMIWEEARPNYLHHFYVALPSGSDVGLCKPIYVCKDVTTGLQTLRLTHANGPDHAALLDPADTRPAQKVKLYLVIYTLHDSINRNLHNIDTKYHGPKRHPFGTSVYLNFDRDVFAFGPDMWPCHRSPSYFDLFRLGHEEDDLQPFQDSHWVLKVQKLALVIPQRRRRRAQYGPLKLKSRYKGLSERDRSTIKRMPNLKQIYVVVGHSWDCRRGLNKQLKVNWNYYGFAPYKEFVEAHYPEPARPYERCECDLHDTAGYELVENMKDIWVDVEKKPDVEVVVERRIRWA